MVYSYYFVMDVDVNNKDLLLPDIIKDELPEMNRLVYSSIDFNDYDSCIQYVVNILKNQGLKHNIEKQKALDIFFEKNPKYDPAVIQGGLQKETDPDYWLEFELVKCYLAEVIDENSLDEEEFEEDFEEFEEFEEDSEDEELNEGIFMNTLIMIRVFVKVLELTEPVVLH